MCARMNDRIYLINLDQDQSTTWFFVFRKYLFSFIRAQQVLSYHLIAMLLIVFLNGFLCSQHGNSVLIIIERSECSEYAGSCFSCFCSRNLMFVGQDFTYVLVSVSLWALGVLYQQSQYTVCPKSLVHFVYRLYLLTIACCILQIFKTNTINIKGSYSTACPRSLDPFNMYYMSMK